MQLCDNSDLVLIINNKFNRHLTKGDVIPRYKPELEIIQFTNIASITEELMPQIQAKSQFISSPDSF